MPIVYLGTDMVVCRNGRVTKGASCLDIEGQRVREELRRLAARVGGIIDKLLVENVFRRVEARAAGQRVVIDARPWINHILIFSGDVGVRAYSRAKPTRRNPERRVYHVAVFSAKGVEPNAELVSAVEDMLRSLAAIETRG